MLKSSMFQIWVIWAAKIAVNNGITGRNLHGYGQQQTTREKNGINHCIVIDKNKNLPITIN